MSYLNYLKALFFLLGILYNIKPRLDHGKDDPLSDGSFVKFIRHSIPKESWPIVPAQKYFVL